MRNSSMGYRNESPATSVNNLSDYVIQVDNVSKTFQTSDEDKVSALENVSLDIRHGEFVTVVGPSGCGKSTLIKLIAGQAKPSDFTDVSFLKELESSGYIDKLDK